jgi:ABC-2 type transport system permease protein
MNKIILIIKREYLTRVRKRSFIVMTVLGPILMAALFIVPAYMAMKQEDKRVITVVDETGRFAGKFENSDNYTFEVMQTDLESAKKVLQKSEGYALLYIPNSKQSVPSNAIVYSDKQLSINLEGYIKDVMAREIERFKLSFEIRQALLAANPSYKSSNDTTAEDLMSEKILKNIRSDIKLTTIQVEANGSEKKSFTGASMVIGMVAGIMIYMFIFLFGVQVMRGVIEEKTNRIVEIIVSSVKPFQLMMGKIVGVALVGLTQFILWIVFTATIILTVQLAFPDQFKMPVQQQMTIKANPDGSLKDTQSQQIQNGDNKDDAFNGIYEAMSSVNYPAMISAFLFYFLFGYLLYSALFAMVGSAVDNETDSQQFMLPVTVPLIFSIVMLQAIVMNPNGPLAFWLSMIPLTSPIVMMIRIPFGVPWPQIVLSASLLIAGFLGATWLAARIYRTGILMYGKKVNYAELWKWIKYKG